MVVVFTTSSRDEARHYADTLEQRGIPTEIIGTRALASQDRTYLVRVADSDLEAVTR